MLETEKDGGDDSEHQGKYDDCQVEENFNMSVIGEHENGIINTKFIFANFVSIRKHCD